MRTIHRARYLVVAIMVAVGALGFLALNAEAATCDLTQSGAAPCTINGAVVGQAQGGTVLLDPFVRVGTTISTFEHGYNTTVNGTFDNDPADLFNRELRLTDVPIVVVSGVAYYKFVLDINQTAPAPLLSLDEVQVFQSATPNQGAETCNGGGACLSGTSPGIVDLSGTLLYRLDAGGDNAIVLNYRLNAGSGIGDMVFLVPVTLFNPSNGEYVYLYSAFGGMDTACNGVYFDNSGGTPVTSSCATNDGFEEWSHPGGGNTPLGPDIVVQPADTATLTAPLTVNFPSVTQAGETTLTISGSGNPPPAGFSLGNPPTYYELSTTAVFTGPVTVCINYTGVSFSDESQLKLFHFENSAWVDQTSFLDTTNNIICGSVTSFSSFAIFESSNALPVANPGPDQVLECSSPSGTPVTLDGSGSSDPDNDTLTYTWTGPFPEGGGTVTGVSPTVTLSLGTSTITLVVNDGTSDSLPVTVDVTIQVFVSGLQAPMVGLSPDGGPPPLLPNNAFRKGRTIPLKLKLSCSGVLCTGANATPPKIVSIVSIGGPVDLTVVDVDAGQANDNGVNFRYDAPDWVFNLSTKGLAEGTYIVTIQVPDGRRFNAGFVIK